MATPPNDLALLGRCRQNDPKAQKILFERYKSMLMGVCLRYASDRNTAEDIFQEAFIKVFSRLDQVREPTRLPGWIKRVGVTTAINHIRRQKQSLLAIEDTETEKSIDFAAQDEALILGKLEQEQLLLLVQSLPEAQRLVFNLFAIEEYTHEEIAELLSIKAASSRVQLHRARQNLRRAIVKMLGKSYLDRYV
ncbi:MAG: sigma-70 family RNA polymerase sigma factor [Bacteroidota bacterium]